MKALIQRKMYKLQKMYKCTFFAVNTFFVGIADEKCITFFLYIFRRGSGNLDEKCIKYFLYIFRFQLRRKMYKYFCKLGKC